jgi:M6 family metalloprotease-like protein
MDDRAGDSPDVCVMEVSMRTRLAAPVLVLISLITFGGLATAAGPYPLPTPDFSHPSAPHDFGGGPLGWQLGTHRLLVIYGRFSDTAAQNRTEAQIEAMFFPEETFGTVVNYFKVASSFSFEFGPAPEKGGEVDNGVVTIELGLSDPFKAMSREQRRRTLLDRADSVVDFELYDTNADDQLTDDELAIVTMYTDPAYTCGQTAGVASGDPLDGNTVAFRTVEGGHLMNVLTFAHEIAHQHMGMTDFYGYGAASYDIAGPTCGGADRFSMPNAWHRLHWGWIPPITVTRDGYFEVSAATTPERSNPITGTSYLLYDPARGTQEYFLIENRQAESDEEEAPGGTDRPSYDQSVADSGLIIWRVDERQLGSSQEHIRPIEIIKPDGSRVPGCVDEDVDGRVDEDPDNDVDDDGDGRIDEDVAEAAPACDGGGPTDAWDPSDLFTPQRAMVGRWGDGTLAKLAVRAIAASSDRMWVYIDVLGPGVMVDPADANGQRLRLSAAIGSSVEVEFPVMNTGEATDTFDFTVTAPSGWSATTQRMTLNAGQQATARITVTIPASAPSGTQIVVARGQSISDSSVLTTAQFDLVLRRPATIQYTGDTTAEYSDPAVVSAIVRDGLSGAGLAGRVVTFTIDEQVARATTDAHGIASASIVLDQQPDTVQVSALVATSSTHLEAEVVQDFVIDEEDLTFSITSPLLWPVGGPVVVAVQATEEDDGSPGRLSLAGAMVQLQPTLTATSFEQAMALPDSGIATFVFEALPSDLWVVSVNETGGYWEAPALTNDLVIVDPDVQLTGFGAGPDSTGERVKLTPIASYSGDTPVGTIEMHSKPNKFKTTQIRWIVVAGTRALVEAEGTFNDSPARLRADIIDSGLSGGMQDRFSLRVTDSDGAVLYETGTVPIEQGNLIVTKS